MSGKSRNRQHRHLHNHDDHLRQPLAAVDGDMPTREQIRAVFDVDAAYQRHLSQVTAEEMLAYVGSMPAEGRKFIMNSLGLGAARQVTRAAAAQLVARLAASGARRDSLAAALFTPTVWPYGADVSAQDWAAFAGDDAAAALKLLVDNTDLFALAATPEPEGMANVAKIALVSAIDAGLAGSAIALGFLATQDGDAAAAYDQLRRTHLMLPAPRRAEDTTASARMHQSGNPWPDDDYEWDPNAIHSALEGALALNCDREDDALPDGLLEIIDNPAGQDATPFVSLITKHWGFARERLAAQVEAMSNDRLPDANALEWVAGFAALISAIGKRVDARTRQELGRAVATLLTKHDINPSRAWLMRLAEMVGPADLTDEIEEVADLARTASELDEHELNEALEALLRLIDLADDAAHGGDTDYDALFQAQEVARQGLPRYNRLIYASSTGQIAVPEASETETSEDLLDDETSSDAELDTHPHAAAVQQEVDDEAADATAEPRADSVEEQLHLINDVLDAELDAVEAIVDASDRSGHTGTVEVADDTEGLEDSEPLETDAAESRDDEISEDDLAALRASAASAPLRRYAHTPAKTSTPTAAVELAQAATAAIPAEPPTAPDRPEWGDQYIAGIDKQLLASGRFALAADIAAVTGAGAACVAARQIAAYAQSVRSATGEMATAFSERAGRVAREELRDDRAGQLIAWAAAAKMAVLAPPAGAADTLINLTPCIEDSPALVEVTEAFVEAARNGVVVVAPEAVQAAGALAAALAKVKALSARADDLFVTAKTRSIKYVPANEVYLRWIAPGGALGAVLTAVRTNDAARAGDVAKTVVEVLRFKGERNIDTVFRTFANRSNKAITAGARQQLLERWDDIISLASAWADACEQVRALSRSDSWQSSALARLRAGIEPNREAAMADLIAWEEVEGIDGDASASALLADAFAVCDEVQPAGDEPTRAFAEHSEFLALPLPMNRATLELDTPSEHLSDLLALAAAPELSSDEVYALLAARAAHDLTEVLVAGARAIDPADGARLESQRNRDLQPVDVQVREEVADLRNDVDVRRLEGALSDRVWSAASARVAQLADPVRRDYERIRASIAAIRVDLGAERAERIATTRDRIANAVAEHGGDVAEYQDHLLALCNAGQLTAAEEQLQQALEGAVITSRESLQDHLRRFFPLVPDAINKYPDALEQIVKLLRDQVGTPLTEDLAAGGVDLFSLSPARTEQAKVALSSWRRLASKTPVAGMTEQDALANILRQAGLEFSGHSFDKGNARNRQWVTLNKVVGVGKALTPVIGSGMSPGESNSLRVLLVRQGATPSTVIEWMSGEPGDRTVLALWLQPTALTAAEWRAIGEASRGRKNPPVIMFDFGTLLYLCAQAEPRRSTLASVTLPFTSANPYRDTPGDAAPEMFYGRTEERSEILDMKGSSFVSGGRQLGKTSLLQDAARRFADLSEHHVAVLLSIYHVGKINAGVVDPPERAWDHVWPELASRGIVPARAPATDLAAAVHHYVKVWLAEDDRRQLIILLDEADDFLDADSQHARFVNVGWFRSLMLDTGRRCKVVLAGLHRTARFESLPNQPLSHLGRPIVVGPLRPQHAFDLLTIPMAAMGYTFDSDMTVARALATANNMPAQLQLLGNSLVDHMSRKPIGPDGPPSVITADDVEDAFDLRLQSLFREKFTLTLTLDPRYKIIAYVVANAAHENGVDTSLTLSELSDQCRACWPEGFATVSADMFRGLVNECVDLGVLAQDGTRYRLRTPTVLRLLGTDIEVFEELADASSKLVVPVVSDSGAFRSPMDDHYSSLTTRQVGSLLKAQRAVTVVAGSNATGLSRVLPSLDHAKTNVPGLEVNRNASIKELPLTSSIARAAGRTWLLVDARHLETHDVARILACAQEATDKTRQPVRTIVAAGPNSAAAWVNWPDRIDLSRYEEQGLAMHADVNNLPFHEPSKIAQFLAATGGWPALVDKVTTSLRDPNTRSDGQGLLDDLAAVLADDPGALCAAAGVDPRNDSALTLVLELALSFTENQPEPADWLAELMEDDLSLKLRTAIRHAEFTNVRDVLAALVALGALVADPDGNLSVEPVLAQDFQRAAR